MTTTGTVKVLIADDETHIRDLFEIILTHALPGLTVDKAGDGLEAVRLFNGYHHDVIIMDLHMPELDGIQAFRLIRDSCEKEKRKMPPVVFCTGFTPPVALCRLIGAGEYHGLLHKPVRSQEIVEVVKAKLALSASVAPS